MTHYDKAAQEMYRRCAVRTQGGLERPQPLSGRGAGVWSHLSPGDTVEVSRDGTPSPPWQQAVVIHIRRQPAGSGANCQVNLSSCIAFSESPPHYQQESCQQKLRNRHHTYVIAWPRHEFRGTRHAVRKFVHRNGR
jgi:hypothetical protein